MYARYDQAPIADLEAILNQRREADLEQAELEAAGDEVSAVAQLSRVVITELSRVRKGSLADFPSGVVSRHGVCGVVRPPVKHP
jgi:hypothetical protein